MGIKIESEINTALSSFLRIQLGGPEVIDGSNAMMNMKGLENSDGNKISREQTRPEQGTRWTNASLYAPQYAFLRAAKKTCERDVKRRRSKSLSP